jgi:hypothetical protein
MATAVVVASTNGFLTRDRLQRQRRLSDPEDQILASRAVTAGTNNVTFNIPTSALVSNRFARFRFSTAGGLSYDGFVPDGRSRTQAFIRPAIDYHRHGAIRDTNWRRHHQCAISQFRVVEVSSNFVYIMSVTNRGPSTATP